MGRKSHEPSGPDRAARRRAFTREELDRIQREFAEIGAELQSLADEMQAKGVGEIIVDGANKPEEARQALRLFVAKARLGIARASL